jgi:hypothetical protein
MNAAKRLMIATLALGILIRVPVAFHAYEAASR